MSSAGFSQYLKYIFGCSVCILRKIYISEMLDSPNTTVEERKRVSLIMAHSLVAQEFIYFSLSNNFHWMICLSFLWILRYFLPKPPGPETFQRFIFQKSVVWNFRNYSVNRPIFLPQTSRTRKLLEVCPPKIGTRKLLEVYRQKICCLQLLNFSIITFGDIFVCWTSVHNFL